MSTLFASQFIQNFLMGGSLLAILCGILGCFLLWRRMAFFSDTLAHASLLGVALGLWLHINLLFGVFLVCLVVALILGIFAERTRHLSTDTWLSLISYSGISVGMIALTKLPTLKVDPQSFLFGDPLSIGKLDIGLVGLSLVATLGYLILNWRALLLATLDEEIAKVNNISISRLQLLFILILTFAVAVGLKTIGALLLPALMIFPAATYSLWARTPESMVVGASFLALVSLWFGSFLSFIQDWPTGPSIIVVAAGLFLGSFFLNSLIKKFKTLL